MSDKLERLFQQLVPYLIAGIALALIIGLFIMFSYIVVWGLLLGVVLWIIAAIKNFFFSTSKKNNRKGRVIDQIDKKHKS